MLYCRARCSDVSMSQSFYHSAGSYQTMGSSPNNNNGVLMSPVVTSSIVLAMAITPTIAAAQTMSDESLTERNKAVVRAYLGEIAKNGNIVAREQYFTPTTTFNGDSDLGRQFARIAEFAGRFQTWRSLLSSKLRKGPGWRRGSPTVARTLESLAASLQRAGASSMPERPWIAWKTAKWWRCGTP